MIASTNTSDPADSHGVLRLPPARYALAVAVILVGWIVVQLVYHRLAPALLPPGMVPLRFPFGMIAQGILGIGLLLAIAARFHDAGLSGKWAFVFLGVSLLPLVGLFGVPAPSDQALMAGRLGLLVGLMLLPRAGAPGSKVKAAAARAILACAVTGTIVWFAFPSTGVHGLVYRLGGASYRDEVLMEFNSGFQRHLPLVIDEYTSVTGALYDRATREFRVEYTVTLDADGLDVDVLREEILTFTLAAECGSGGAREWARLFAVEVGVVFDYRDKSGTPITSVAVPPDLCDRPPPGDTAAATGA